MARTPKEPPSRAKDADKRRSNWAALLQDQMPDGRGRKLPDDQLEIALDLLIRPR